MEPMEMMGKLWVRGETNFYVFAQVGFFKYSLINVRFGNRFSDPVGRDGLDEMFESFDGRKATWQEFGEWIQNSTFHNNHSDLD